MAAKATAEVISSGLTSLVFGDRLEIAIVAVSVVCEQGGRRDRRQPENPENNGQPVGERRCEEQQQDPQPEVHHAGGGDDCARKPGRATFLPLRLAREHNGGNG